MFCSSSEIRGNISTFFSISIENLPERLSYPLCKPGVFSSIPGFSSLSDETLNRDPVSI